MSVIEASSVTVKTMADNTLRLTVDIEPRFAKQAFALFGERGTSMALAALKPGAQPEPEPEKPKGGALAKLAGIWCNNLMFREWASKQEGRLIDSEQSAASFIRNVCGIDSRAELDSNHIAALAFQNDIRGPFMKYMAFHGFTAPEYAEA